jgi:hypothetical protein
MSEHAWSGLTRPEATANLTVRRVSASIPWDFFWAVDIDGRYLLVLQHRRIGREGPKLPRLRGIEVILRDRDEEQDVLIFRLLDSTHRDIFERLCSDVVEQCSALRSEDEVIQTAIARTWRWHHLLRGGDDRLGEEAQKGLVGELLVLEQLLIPNIGCNAAVMAWQGPLDAPKDFEIGPVAIEAKARRGAAAPFVTISSEHQLDTTGLDTMFLHVVDLSRTSADSLPGASITTIAGRVRSLIAACDSAALERFDSLLLSAGLDLQENYEDWLWLEGKQRLYRVDESFPRLESSKIPQGVSWIQYRLSLTACEPHLINEADLLTQLGK